MISNEACIILETYRLFQIKKLPSNTYQKPILKLKKNVGMKIKWIKRQSKRWINFWYGFVRI